MLPSAHGCCLPTANPCCFLPGCISRYSAGSVYYYQSYHHKHNPVQVEKLQKELKRYLTRKIGFEAVMRIRCTKGLDVALWVSGEGWKGSEHLLFLGIFLLGVLPKMN